MNNAAKATAGIALIGAATAGIFALGLGGDLTLTVFSLSTNAVDVDSAEATVTCNMTITDGGGTPVLDAGCTINPPTGQPLGCTAHNGAGDVWSCNVTIPRYAVAGTWAIHHLTIRDTNYVTTTPTNAELVADGPLGLVEADLDVVVTSTTPDSMGPIISFFSALPADPDPGDTVTCTINATDTPAGMLDRGCTFTSTEPYALSCTAHGDTATCPLVVPVGADAGVTWNKVNHLARDLLGNRTLIEDAETFCVSCGGAGGAGGSGGAGGGESQLLVHYEFESDCPTDSSGNSRPATCASGAAWTGADGEPSAGSVSLDGTNDYVLVGGASSLYEYDTEPFTVAAWVKLPDAQNDYCSVWSKGDPGSNAAGFSLGRDFLGGGDGNVVVATVINASTGAQYAVGSGGIWDDTWHHVAMVRDGTSLTVYVDGLPGTTVGVEDTLVTDTEEFWIGGYTDYPGGHTAGLEDDFRVYDRALSSEEILTLAGVTSGYLVVDVSDLNPSCSGSVDWEISPGSHIGTGDWGPTLVRDDTYTMTWGDSIYDCIPPSPVPKDVNEDTQTFDLVATDYTVRNTTRQVDIKIRQDGGDCDPVGCDDFGPWTLTATNFAGEGTLASGTGTYDGESICDSACDHTADMLDGRSYTSVFDDEVDWNTPSPGTATASATPQPITGNYLETGILLWASTEQVAGLPCNFTTEWCEYACCGDGEGVCSDANGVNVTRINISSEGLPADGGHTYAVRQYVGNDVYPFWRSELGAWTGGNPTLLAHMQTGASTFFIMDVYIPSEITWNGNFLSIWDFHSSAGGAPIGFHTCPGIMLQNGTPTMRLRSVYAACDNDYENGSSTLSMPWGEWFTLEIEYRYSSSNGGVSVWINGTLALADTGRNTHPGGDTPQFYSKIYGEGLTPLGSPAPLIIYRKNYRASASPFH